MQEIMPDAWKVHTLECSVTESYFATKSLYEEVKGEANTFIGVADPATFAVIAEAIGDSGGISTTSTITPPTG